MKKELIIYDKEIIQEYLHDESRLQGQATSISFVRNQDELIQIVQYMQAKGIPLTIQGARTGITGGAVPKEGHIINLSRMNKVTGLEWQPELNTFFLTVEPGITLSSINQMLNKREFYCTEWDKTSLESLDILKHKQTFFFAPDPTEDTASIGGMAACNASGARSFYYGPTRKYVQGMAIIMADGSIIHLERGREQVENNQFHLTSLQGKVFSNSLPRYTSTDIKNAAGYYVKSDMDLIDLFVGAEGTLGIISRLKIKLTRKPKVIWGVIFFFTEQAGAVDFIITIRRQKQKPVALEFMDNNALNLLRLSNSKGFPVIPALFKAAVYVELHGQEQTAVEKALIDIAEIAAAHGGDQDFTCMATTPKELNKLREMRHFVPEKINSLINEYKRQNPSITKLSTDMAVGNDNLHDLVNTYHDFLDEAALQYVMFGHIGDNHLHVNIIPRNEAEYEEGKIIFGQIAGKVIKMGGTVSAEHGIGKLKVDLLKQMYSGKKIQDMKKLKKVFDPHTYLNRGNLFTFEVAQTPADR